MPDPDDDFFVLWALLREEASGQSSVDFVQLREGALRLSALATGSREKALANATNIKIGARIGDEVLLNRSVNEVAALSGEEQREAIQVISDLTCLGRPTDRWRLVKRAIEEVGDPAVAFIEAPSTEAAAQLVVSDWMPADTLIPELRSELRLQVGWSALELFLGTREKPALDLCQMRQLRFRDGQELGWWERSLQLVGLSLVKGDIDEGVSRLVTLLRQDPPAWASQRIRFEIVRFAPLAVGRIDDWLKLCPGGLPSRQEAPSASLAASVVIAEMLFNPSKGKPGKIADVGSSLELTPWALFGLFTSPNLRESLRDHLGLMLRSMSFEQWVLFPWDGRVEAFVAACERCGELTIAVEMLIRLNHLHKVPETALAIGRILSRCNPQEIAGLDIGLLAQEFGTELEDGPPALVALLRRGGVIRAAVDGSNVMWGGRGRGGRPEMQRLQKLVGQLREAGYHHVGVFVDAATRYDLNQNDARELELWKARNDVVEIRGQADPAIIRYFLEHPQTTEIFTNDDFRDWRNDTEFADLDHWWPACRRSFYFDPNESLRFSVPLDRPLR